jgi:hypothetical protein
MPVGEWQALLGSDNEDARPSYGALLIDYQSIITPAVKEEGLANYLTRKLTKGKTFYSNLPYRNPCKIRPEGVEAHIYLIDAPVAYLKHKKLPTGKVRWHEHKSADDFREFTTRCLQNMSDPIATSHIIAIRASHLPNVVMAIASLSRAKKLTHLCDASCCKGVFLRLILFYDRAVPPSKPTRNVGLPGSY